MSNPSRFDLQYGRLLSGKAETLFDTSFKYYRRTQCEVRLMDDDTPLLENTKALFLLGPQTLKRVGREETLGELRGSPFRRGDRLCIASYLPQDCLDPIDHESSHNEYIREKAFEGDTEDGDEDYDGDAKTTKGITRRKNWKFWFQRDCHKIGRLVKDDWLNTAVAQPQVHIFPSAETIIQLLTTTKNEYLYLDIENDEFYNINCIGFSFDDINIYVVPVVRFYKEFAYKNILSILGAFAIALRDNTCVCHNGARWDWIVLALKYGIIPGRRVVDTLVSWHRLFPEVEKSLGHLISTLTTLPYHKNEGVFNPRNKEQEEQLWQYNAKDVHSMVLVHRGIQRLAEVMGATESIQQANDSIVPYLTTTLHGVPFDPAIVDEKMTYAQRRMNCMLRILEVLVGQPLNPNSSQQVSKYLYDGLGLKRPKDDLTAEKTLLKIITKQDVPAISAIIETRRIKKEMGMLKFVPWKGEFKYAGE